MASNTVIPQENNSVISIVISNKCIECNNKGTKRAKLIDEKVIIEKDIRTENIEAYSVVCLFNAMIDFGEMIIGMNNIKR